MKYGMPYKGSKNKLAGQIFELFPRKKNFYDLFCGGCAMTHYGLLHGGFENFYMNDINPACPELFMDAVHGKFKDEKRWISREDFEKLKDVEPYVAFCWSFGNNLKAYLYSKEIEPLKKALHYARVFNDFSLFEEMNINLKNADLKTVKENKDEIIEKYIVWYVKKYFKKQKTIKELKEILTNQTSNEDLRLYLCEALKKSGLTQSEVDKRNNNQMSGHFFGKSQWQFPSRENYLNMQKFLPLEKDYDEIYGLQNFLLNFYKIKRIGESQNLESLCRLESLERLQNLESLERLQNLESLERLQTSSTSYEKIKIKENSVIYCDIPYEGTDGYLTEFDFEKFYSWCEKQTEPLFISSYKMPADRFVCVAMFKHRCILSPTENIEVTEKVFIPKHQEKEYHLPGSLFNFDEMK